MRAPYIDQQIDQENAPANAVYQKRDRDEDRYSPRDWSNGGWNPPLYPR